MYFSVGQVRLTGNQTSSPKGIGKGSRLRQNGTNIRNCTRTKYTFKKNNCIWNYRQILRSVRREFEILLSL